MVEKRNEKVARLVLESSFMAEKRQCDGKKKGPLGVETVPDSTVQ